MSQWSNTKDSCSFAVKQAESQSSDAGRNGTYFQNSIELSDNISTSDDALLSHLLDRGFPAILKHEEFLHGALREMMIASTLARNPFEISRFTTYRKKVR